MLLETQKEKKEKILQLNSRRKIYEIIKDNPGCHFRELERLSKIPHGTLKYNLNFLVKNDLLILKKDRNNIRYFCNEFNKENIEIITLLRHKQYRKIILFVLLNKDSGNEDISKSIKLSPSTVS